MTQIRQFFRDDGGLADDALSKLRAILAIYVLPSLTDRPFTADTSKPRCSDPHPSRGLLRSPGLVVHHSRSSSTTGLIIIFVEGAGNP